MIVESDPDHVRAAGTSHRLRPAVQRLGGADASLMSGLRLHYAQASEGTHVPDSVKDD